MSRVRACPAWYRIAFDPVPVRPRHDGWSARRQRDLVDLAEFDRDMRRLRGPGRRRGTGRRRR